MRKFIGMLAALVMGATFLVAAPAQAAYHCQDVIDRKVERGWPDDEYTEVVVMYRSCVDTGDRLPYVKPYLVIVTYDFPGSHMTCDPVLRKYDGLRFNMYFWRPYNGINFNPPAQEIGCDESTRNTGQQVYRLEDVPRLHFGPGYGDTMQPRWKINWTLRYNFRDDVNKAHAQDFNPVK